MTARSSFASLGLVAGVTLCLAACAPGTTRTTFPPLGVTPAPAGDATAAARAEVIAALAQVGLPASETARTFRPPEGALLAAAPRTILQVALPDDPTRGFIVFYEFPSPTAASAAARDHADYVGSNSGGINYVKGTRFVIRVVGPTVVFFHWSPEVSTDDRAQGIEDALLRIGSGVQVPS